MTSSYPPRWDPAGRPLPPGRRSRSRRPPLCVRDTISKFPWFPVCSLRVLLADLADGRLAIRTFHEQPVVVGIVGQLRASRVPAEAVVHGRHAAAQDDLLIISVILGVLAGAGPGADRSSLHYLDRAVGDGFLQAIVGALLGQPGPQIGRLHLQTGAIEQDSAGVMRQAILVGIDHVRRFHQREDRVGGTGFSLWCLTPLALRSEEHT